METGHALTAWTVRAALLAYAAAIGLGFPATLPVGRSVWRLRASRGFWTAGSLLMLAHVASAFEFYHDWNHRRAFDDTAKQTEELLGWAFGGGIFFSYVFAVVWFGDALWWWVFPAGFARRPTWVHWSVHVYLAFIVFNGAVVFESGMTRWVGLGLSPVLALISYRRYREAQLSTRT